MLFECTRELLFNVAKYAGVGDATVSLREEVDRLRLVVEDRGRGFDVAATIKDPRQGGFGLFSIRERLAALGGCMKIESSLGEGTRTELQIPLLSAPIGEAMDRPAVRRVPVATVLKSRSAAHSNRTRVLVVDDHAIVREGIANILNRDDRLLVVGEAADGIEALEAVERQQPDVVLLDVNMPRMNGVEAAREICRRWPETAIIGLSVQGDGATAKSMLDAGAAGFIPKSGDSERMISTILRLTSGPAIAE